MVVASVVESGAQYVCLYNLQHIRKASVPDTSAAKGMLYLPLKRPNDRHCQRPQQTYSLVFLYTFAKQTTRQLLTTSNNKCTQIILKPISTATISIPKLCANCEIFNTY